MKRIVIRGGFLGNSMIVQSAATMLIGKPLVQLAVGQDLSLEKGFEVDAAEAVAVRRVGTVMHSSQAGEESTTGWGHSFGWHRRSLESSGPILLAIDPPRQERGDSNAGRPAPRRLAPRGVA